jgi:hypothetical protein
MCYLKERLKLTIKAFYSRFSKSFLILGTFLLKVMNYPPSWIIEDTHLAPQVTSGVTQGFYLDSQ